MAVGEGAGSGVRSVWRRALVMAPTVVVAAVGAAVATWVGSTAGWVGTVGCLAGAVAVAVYETGQAPRRPGLKALLSPRWPRLGSVAMAAGFLVVPVVVHAWAWEWAYVVVALAVGVLLWASDEVGKSMFRLTGLATAVAVVVALGVGGAAVLGDREAAALEREQAEAAAEDLEGVVEGLEAEAGRRAGQVGEVAVPASCPEETPAAGEGKVAEERRRVAVERQRLWCQTVGWWVVLHEVAASEAARAATDGTELGDPGWRKADEAKAKWELERAREALVTAEAAVAELSGSPSPVAVHRLVAEGLDRVVDVVTPDVGEGSLAVVVGGAGYLFLGLLVLVGYRGLELRNNAQYGAPIEVADISGEVGDQAKALTQRLHQKVLGAGILEPGPLPGSSTGGHLAKLLQEAEGVPNNALAAAMLTFVQAVAFPPPGVKVTTAVTRREGDRYEASVEISTRVAGRFVGGQVLTAGNVVDLVDAVADFVATDSLNFGRRNPVWVRWQDSTGGAFGRYRKAQQRSSASAPGTDAVAQFEDCLRDSPANGMVRLALAHEYDLRGRRLQALRLHLVTAIDYPTLLKSRYRLATSLLMLSQPVCVEEQWQAEATATVRDEVIQMLVERYGRRRMGWRSREIRRDLTSERAPQVTRRLRLLAERELRAMRHQLLRRRLLWLAVAPGERGECLRLVRDPSDRHRRAATYETVWLGTFARLHLAGGGDVPSVPLRWWTFHRLGGFSTGSLSDWRRAVDRVATFDRATPPSAHYNAACIYSDLVAHFEAMPQEVGATSGEIEHAVAGGFRHLDAALRRGGPDLFSRAWLRADPDLAALRARTDRFDVIVDAYTSPPPQPPSVERPRSWRTILTWGAGQRGA